MAWNKLQVHIDVQSGQHHLRVPPMALQMLLENAVKHNVASRAKPLQVQITGEGQCLSISNNLQKRKFTEPSTGLGLQNLNQRCKYLSKRALIIQQTHDRFAVTIPLKRFVLDTIFRIRHLLKIVNEYEINHALPRSLIDHHYSRCAT